MAWHTVSVFKARTGPCIGCTWNRCPRPPRCPPADNASTQPTAELAQYLEEERTRLRSDMQVILAEADHYDHLLKRFPDEYARITPLLEEALDRGGELKGQLDANIRLRNTLVGKEGQA